MSYRSGNTAAECSFHKDAVRGMKCFKNAQWWTAIHLDVKDDIIIWVCSGLCENGTQRLVLIRTISQSTPHYKPGRTRIANIRLSAVPEGDRWDWYCWLLEQPDVVCSQMGEVGTGVRQPRGESSIPYAAESVPYQIESDEQQWSTMLPYPAFWKPTLLCSPGDREIARTSTLRIPIVGLAIRGVSSK